ncbi:uncharacterized protein V6R79_002909 [Siganus canaliculatus]
MKRLQCCCSAASVLLQCCFYIWTDAEEEEEVVVMQLGGIPAVDGERPRATRAPSSGSRALGGVRDVPGDGDMVAQLLQHLLVFTHLIQDVFVLVL